MSQAGLPRPEKVMLVSAVKGSGVRDLIEEVKAGLGFRQVVKEVTAVDLLGLSTIFMKCKNKHNELKIYRLCFI